MKVHRLALKLKKQEVVISFQSGDTALIDREDLELFAKLHWYPAKGHGQTKYLKANIRKDGARTTIEFHRAILGPSTPGFEIDHINRNGLDNRKANLRVVTHRQNQSNLPKRSGGASKFYGVYFEKERHTWVAQVQIKNSGSHRTTLGRFKTELEAMSYRELMLARFPEKYSGQRNGSGEVATP